MCINIYAQLASACGRRKSRLLLRHRSVRRRRSRPSLASPPVPPGLLDYYSLRQAALVLELSGFALSLRVVLLILPNKIHIQSTHNITTN